MIQRFVALLVPSVLAACATTPWLEQVEPATNYATDSVGKAVPFAAGRAEAALMAQAARYHMELQGDGRLATLADAVLDHLARKDAMPPPEQIDAMARRMGITDELSFMGFWNAEALEAGAARMFEGLPSNIRYNRFGIAKFHSGHSFAFGVILSVRLVQLQPVPRHVPVGTAVHIAGHLLPPGKTAFGFVTPPSGAARSMGRMSGGDFAFTLRPSAPGVYRVEVMADAGEGPRIAAILPIYADMGESAALPASPTATQAARLPANAPNEAIVARILELLNQARTTAGAAPLTLDPALNQLARGHAQDMVDHAFFAHVSPTHGDPARRAAVAHLPVQWTGENIALAQTAEQADQGLMASPGHRMNLLNPLHNRVGIGVVRGKAEHGSLYVAVEFGYALPPPETARTIVLEVLNQARAQNGQAPLTWEPGWSEALQALASQCIGQNPVSMGVLAAQLKVLALQPPLPAGFQVQSWPVIGLLQVPPSVPRLGAGMRQIGMAFGMGEADAARGTAAYVLILVAPEGSESKP